jgi:phosphohistidine phosphatase
VKLYVIRHGRAGYGERSDAERELTAEGRARFARAVAGLHALGVRLDAVLSSPMVRAVQTAELLEPVLEAPVGEGRRAIEELAHAPSGALLDALETSRVALVGHEPWQSELVAWLVTGECAHSHGFGFDPGMVVALEGRAEPGRMLLAGLWRPDLLELLGSRA